MPQIDDVVGTKTDVTQENATTETVATDVVTETPVVEGVVEATTVDKPKTKKPKAKKPTTESTESTESETEKPAKKAKKAKTESETEDPKLIRPPMDIITRDFEQMVTDHEIAGTKIKKLGYKCGKMLFGISSEGEGKDFRIFAYKARKKTRTVAGKSRCIFYFGLVEDAAKLAKDITGATSSKFGKCAVQSKTPVQLVLDKVTYNETFAQNADKVTASLEKLINLTIKQRTASWKELQKKKTEKTETTKDE